MAGGSRSAGFSFLRLRSSVVSLTRVRPQLAAMRQSSGIDLGTRPLVRIGRLSPDSKTSMAASQYGVGVFGSPSSASEGFESIMQPNINKVVPRRVWNAVGKSTQGLSRE
jgi:hypothetical protein